MYATANRIKLGTSVTTWRDNGANRYTRKVINATAQTKVTPVSMQTMPALLVYEYDEDAAEARSLLRNPSFMRSLAQACDLLAELD